MQSRRPTYKLTMEKAKVFSRATGPFAGIAMLFLIGLILEAAARSHLLDHRFFPAPSTVLYNLSVLFWSSDFHLHLQASLLRLTGGVLLAGGLSFLVLIGASLSPAIRLLMNGLTALVYPLPKSALLPFLFLLVGLNDLSHILLIASGCATLLLTTLDAGLTRLRQAGYLELARVLGLSKARLLMKVILPGLAPEALIGLKLGVSYSLVLLIVSEMMATRYGLGVLMWTSWDQFKIVDLYSVFYLLSLSGLLLFGFFGYLAEVVSEPQQGLL